MRVVIDSCVWIACMSKRDANYEAARRIIKEVFQDAALTVCVTDYVVLEVVNFLLRKTGPDLAFKTLDMFEKHGRIDTFFMSPERFEETSKIARKYKTSLTDASLITLMKSTGIRTIYSFDSGFDKVKGVERKDG
jgi:predicted nucleic acid-binding protein